MITDIEDYFTKGCGRCDRFATADCSTRRWIDGLNQLRAICKEVGLEEHVKWGHPCYMHQGRNIALLGAFRDNFRFNFMNASLMKDPEGVLEKQGEMTQNPNMLRFTDNGQVAEKREIIIAYLKELMGYAEAGIKPQRQEREIELPEELIEALASDPEFSEAFDALTPGRQRSYAIVIGGAKQSATRAKRVEKYRDKIFAGKGANEY
jgi:uncharacterized protein YdeI (YjbR/CyaY-like superfamily)